MSEPYPLRLIIDTQLVRLIIETQRVRLIIVFSVIWKFRALQLITDISLKTQSD